MSDALGGKSKNVSQADKSKITTPGQDDQKKLEKLYSWLHYCIKAD